MKMNGMMQNGIFWICVGMTFLVIGFIGYGINYYVDKKLSGIYRSCDHGYIVIERAGVRASLRNVEICEGGSLVAIDGEGKEYLLLGQPRKSKKV